MIRGYIDITFGCPTKFFYLSFHELWFCQHEKNNFLDPLKTAEGPQNPHILMNYILTSLRICGNLTIHVCYFFFLKSSFQKFSIKFFLGWISTQQFLGVSGRKVYFDAFQRILNSFGYKMILTSLTNPEII